MVDFPPYKVVTPNNWFWKILSSVTFILCIYIIFALWTIKPKTRINALESALHGSRSEVEFLHVELDKTQALLRNNDKTLQRFKRSLESYGDSITLLGTLNNENFSCAKHGQNDFLYLNSDWSLNRVPKYIQMSEKDKEYYIKHLSTKSHGNNGFAPNKPFPLIPIYEIDLPQQ